MEKNNCGIGLVVFGLAILNGVSFHDLLISNDFICLNLCVAKKIITENETGRGSGTSGSNDYGCDKIKNGVCYPFAKVRQKSEVTIPLKPDSSITTPLRITSQPKPPYTDIARANQIQGVVRLKVTFLANGLIGEILQVSGLPDGLTEQAILAAKNIKFEPKKSNLVPQTTTKVIEYRFTIY